MTKTSSEVPVKSEKGEKAMVSREPWSTLRSEIDDVFDRFNVGWPRMLGQFDPFERMGVPFKLARMDMSPRVDVGEDEKRYEISAELPGMDEEDIDVTIDHGVLMLKGEKKQESDREEKDFHVTERSYGSFQRSFRLPEDVEADKVSASFKKGVLKVALPKSKKARSTAQRVKIESS